MKDESSIEQFVLYPHGSYLASTDSLLTTNESTSIVDLSLRKQPRSRSDSEHSVEPAVDSSLNSTRKRNNLSESELNNEATPTNSSSISPPATTASSNKSNLARTAILLAAKRAACNNNNTNGNANNYDGFTFNIIDGTEDEADSNAGVFKQRFDTIDLTDEVMPIVNEKN